MVWIAFVKHLLVDLHDMPHHLDRRKLVDLP